MKKFFLALGAALCIASAASAQFPANGHIGLYGDMAGTQCCFSLPTFVPVVATVWANLSGATAAGITGAEYRLEFQNATYSAALFTWTPSPASNLSLGNPHDTSPGVDPAPGGFEGNNIAFPLCQTGTGGRLQLGTLQMVALAALGECEVLTKSRNPPTNLVFGNCPLFTLCDIEFTKVCLTIPNDPLMHGESISFRSGINRPSCDSSCQPVAVANNTWSAVKDLYR